MNLMKPNTRNLDYGAAVQKPRFQKAKKIFYGLGITAVVGSAAVIGIRGHLKTSAQKEQLLDSVKTELVSQGKLAGLDYGDLKDAIDASYDYGFSKKDILVILEMKKTLSSLDCFFKHPPTVDMIVETLLRNPEWIATLQNPNPDPESQFDIRAAGYRKEGFNQDADRMERINAIISAFNRNASAEFRQRIFDNAK